MRWLAVPVCFVLGSGVVFAQDRCGPARGVLDWLWSGWQERPVAVLDAGGGEDRSFMVFGNEATGTWTILVASGGVWCVVASGEGYMLVPSVPFVPDEDG